MKSFGLSFCKQWYKDFFYGFLIGSLLIVFIFTVQLFFGFLKITQFSWQVLTVKKILFDLFYAVINYTIVAIIEEVVLRGYILQTLEEAVRLKWAVIISSLSFGLFHLNNFTGNILFNIFIPFALSLLGVLFSFAYLAKRNLWIPIGLHTGWNLFMYRILPLVEINNNRILLINTSITGPMWLVGLPESGFGPEVSLLGILAMLIGMFLIKIIWKNT